MLLRNAIIISFFSHLIIFLFILTSFPNKSNNVGNTHIIQAHLYHTRIINKKFIFSKNNSDTKKITREKNIINDKHNKNRALIKLEKNLLSLKSSHSISSFQQRGKSDRLLLLLHNLISEHQHYPSASLALKQQGDVEVGFLLQPNGEIKNIHLLQSSHYHLLDKAALDAVSAISPILNAEAYIYREKNIAVWIRFKSRE